MRPEVVDAFIYGSVVGLLVGCAVGAAGMFAIRAQAVDEYVMRTLNEMSEEIAKKWLKR